MAARGVPGQLQIRRRAGVRMLIPTMVSVALGALLAPAGVETQQTVQLGTIVSAGRVTYFAAHAASLGSWTLSLSARQSLRDGRWDSAAVDIARAVWSPSGGRVEFRAIGRHDRLKGPHGAAIAGEATWHATSRLTLAGNTALSLHESNASARSIRFRSAFAGARVRLVDAVALTTLVTVDARGRVRMDLFVYGGR